MKKRYKFQDYEAVWQHSQASGNDLLLLLALVKFRQPKGMYATKETLASVMNCNVDTVERSLKRLRALGELDWVRGFSVAGRANRYSILLPGLDLHTPAVSTAVSGAVSTADSPFEPPQTHPLNPRNITPLNIKETEIKHIYQNVMFDLSLGSEFRQAMVEVKNELGLTVDQVEGCLERFQRHPSFFRAENSKVQAFRFLTVWLPNEVKGIPQKQQGYSIAEGDK